MRKGIIGLFLFLSISLLPAYSAIPPKAGSVCSKQGITKTYQGKKYTCLKSGKKLVWNKGVDLKKAMPSPSPTPSPTPSPIEQTITLNLPATLQRDQSPFNLQAIASSDLAVQLQIETPDICKLTGNQLTSLATGDCTITATQSGGPNYLPVSKKVVVTILPKIVLLAAGGERYQPPSAFPSDIPEKNPTLSATPELTILPPATVGSSYSYKFIATGGSHPPYFFQLGQGMIPPGMTFNNITGELSGVPTRSGKFLITLGAMDTDYSNPNAAWYLGIGKYVNYAYGNFELNISGTDDPNSPYIAIDWAKTPGVIPYPMEYYLDRYGGKTDLVTIDGIHAIGLSTIPNKGFSTGSYLGAQSNKATMAYTGLAKHFYSGREKFYDDEGFDTWTRLKVYFPHDYSPSGLFNGEWNWLAGWHTDDYTQTQNGNSILLGVFASKSDSNGRGSDSRLVLRLMGGETSKKLIDSRTCSQPEGALKLQHWYDVVIHMIWSSDPKIGKAELWIDGENMCSTNFPTLYTNPNGSKSWNNGFGLYNYRPMHDWSSTIYYGKFSIGPTAQSIGFPRP